MYNIRGAPKLCLVRIGVHLHLHCNCNLIQRFFAFVGASPSSLKSSLLSFLVGAFCTCKQFYCCSKTKQKPNNKGEIYRLYCSSGGGGGGGGADSKVRKRTFWALALFDSVAVVAIKRWGTAHLSEILLFSFGFLLGGSCVLWG